MQLPNEELRDSEYNKIGSNVCDHGRNVVARDVHGDHLVLWDCKENDHKPPQDYRKANNINEDPDSSSWE